MQTKGSVLILGIGNYLMGDEGVGVHLIKELEKEELPEEIELLDGGTGGFQLMEYLENYSNVIMVDATLDNNPTGSIRLIEPKFSKDFPKAMSTHEIGLKDLVESLSLLGKLPRIYLYVVTVEDIAHLHVGLSPKVEHVLSELKLAVVSKAKEIVEAEKAYLALI